MKFRFASELIKKAYKFIKEIGAFFYLGAALTAFGGIKLMIGNFGRL